jgi:hypothetical protein
VAESSLFNLLFCNFCTYSFFLGRFIKDPYDQNTLKITDLQFEDGGTYTCVARTDVDEVRTDATLVVQDRPNRPRIDSVMCTSGSSKNGINPKVKIDWSSGGENNAKILHFILQFNTSFTPTEWMNVQVSAQREVSASVENTTDDEITRLTLVRKFESNLFHILLLLLILFFLRLQFFFSFYFCHS